MHNILNQAATHQNKRNVRVLPQMSMVDLSANDANKWRAVLQFKDQGGNSLPDPDLREQAKHESAHDFMEKPGSIRHYQRRLSSEQLGRIVEKYKQAATRW